MNPRIEGGKSRQPSTTAILVLPAALVSIALMGVTSVPLLGVNEARREFQAAQELVGQYQLESARLSELRRGVDPEHVERQGQQLDVLLPSSLEPLDTFTLLRLAARASGLVLESVDLGTLYDLVAVIDGKTVYMQDVRIAAVDRPTALARFIQTLREGGYPVVVHDLNLARSSPRSPTFRARMSLGLLYLAPPPAAVPAGPHRDPETPADPARFRTP